MLKKILPAFLVLIFSTISCGVTNEVYNSSSDEQIEYLTENNDADDENFNNKYEKMQDYVKNAPQTIENYLPILDRYGYGMIDISRKSDKEYTKIPLLDGDYVIGNKDADYFAEYHRNGAIMGCIKQELVEIDNNKFTQVFYEYRIPNVNNYTNTTNIAAYSLDMEMKLKHILIVSYDANSKQASQYIYNSDGELLCSQIGDDLYISPTARNMIPNWDKKLDYTEDGITVYTHKQTPGIPVIKIKKNTATRKVIKKLMSPFVAVGSVAVLAFFPIIMSDPELLNLMSDTYDYYDSFTTDEVYSF